MPIDVPARLHGVSTGGRRGYSLLAPSITRRLIEEVTRRRSPVRHAGPELDRLTGREREVLELVAAGLRTGPDDRSGCHAPYSQRCDRPVCRSAWLH